MNTTKNKKAKLSKEKIAKILQRCAMAQRVGLKVRIQTHIMDPYIRVYQDYKLVYYFEGEKAYNMFDKAREVIKGSKITLEQYFTFQNC